MYYEEKLINGMLMFKTMPDGDWSRVSLEKLAKRVIDAEQSVRVLEYQLEEAEKDIN